VICIAVGLFGAAGFIRSSNEIGASGQQSQADVVRTLREEKSKVLDDPAVVPRFTGMPVSPGAEGVIRSSQKQPQSPKGTATEPVYYCGAMTKKGTPCTRRVKIKGTFCWQHASKSIVKASGNGIDDISEAR
jgi:hypothetical protein